MSRLFTPLRLRDLRFRNRLWVSPMCMYSATDGLPSDFHLVHLGSRAVGGAGLVIAEATGVSPAGRISPGDTGLWNDEQEEAFRRIATFIRKSGAAAGIQLAHAGRKASTEVPWRGGKPLAIEEGGWETLAPTAEAFDGYAVPRAMSEGDIREVIGQFASSARRAVQAGFEVLEIHGAHGYLIHEFLSPLSNRRADRYGGSFENRVRFLLEVTREVRKVQPPSHPLFVRLSCSDWVEGGWDLDQSIAVARLLRNEGVDLIDCSSGGNVPRAPIPVGPGYQVPFAEAIRREAGIATAAVGLITDAEQAEAIVSAGSADAVVMARELLRDPYFPLHAAQQLGDDVEWPVQYGRAKSAGTGQRT